MANIAVVYILWLLGGLFGFHHFYLKRDRHAFVWWCTLGGLGFGWFRDLWRLPEYIFDANDDPRYIYEFKDRVKRHSRPPFNGVRFTGELLMGAILAFLCRLTIPEEYTDFVAGKLWVTVVPPLGASIGVYLVANIGREKMCMKWPLFGAYILSPMALCNTTCITYIVLGSAIFTNWKGSQWRLSKDRKGFCQRVLGLSVAGCVYLYLWGSTISFNVTVSTNYGEHVPVNEAVRNFFKSPAWKEMKSFLHNLHESYKVHGWKKMIDELMMHLDPGGEQNALNVLGLSANASLEEVKQNYRQLSRQYHPDKQKSDDDKNLAQQKFIEIQEAYEKLSMIKFKRGNKNKNTFRKAAR